MAQSLSSLGSNVESAVSRRLVNKTHGLGYWAAFDYNSKKNRRLRGAAKIAGKRAQMIQRGLIKPSVELAGEKEASNVNS